ncbi:glycosyltransferase involved in cell wall biosynthesis [Spinactinospora alkalitolerans]|uniref:Glycosyltransferase involved in cell wall biosynthesis n=1 Tax=Spinactinospora alkalitolerans TaxID=687207 RepID=A0A852TUR0_9ACTN|nr:glycosyltransferase involved in cell wall biosynthesis [Spinactinospora alkalitolerans]
MPTFEQSAFLPRAVAGLLAQDVPDWELIVVDDGSTDGTPDALRPFLRDPRVRCHRSAVNRGLGAAANIGLDMARAPLIAYLPSDDVYDRTHLAVLLEPFDDDGVVLAWSGTRHGDAAEFLDGPCGGPLQLVQVMHRRTPDRWVERSELESDDLDRLLWSALRRRGRAVGTGRVTCTWTDHPDQRHKAIRERHDGGLNVFRRRYRIADPLRFHTSDGTRIDERRLYDRFRRRPHPAAPDGLRILLVGELSYQPERVLALAERGHRLHGLWTPDGLGVDTVGPLPFGHVADVPAADWPEAVRELRPDVVYAQLGWRAVPFAHEVMRRSRGVPFVWHFKESPQRSIARGEWRLLADLCTRADALVLSTPEEREWFELALPGRIDPARTLVIDGSLPKADWLRGRRAERLAERDGAPHTAVLGRPLGFGTDFLAELTALGIHVHLHGLVDGPGPQGRWRDWLGDALHRCAGRLHVHPPVDQRDWVRVLSRYDAGWLHRFTSRNNGDLRAAGWDDLNHPARVGTLLAAGLPLLQVRNPGCTVAMERFVTRHRVGLLYDGPADLAARLHDDGSMSELRASIWPRRHEFTFDHRVDELIALFRRLREEGATDDR